MFLSLSILHIILVVGCLLLPALIWIAALIDIVKSDFKDTNNKIIWVLIVILLPVLGSILYFIMGKSQKI